MSTASPSSTSSGIPTTLPGVITPEGGVPREPANSTLIQIGFTYALNYPFVVSNTISVAQIFNYFPQGIAHGLEITDNKVTMHTLKPYDTTKELGYVTTLALAFVPTDLVTKLELALHTPAGKLYSPPDDSTRQLMSLINPTFPLTANQPPPGSNPGMGGSGSGSNEAGADGSLFGGAPQNKTVSGKTIGIGLAVAAGAAAYGAAMFFVARRYRQRKQRHQRVSSVTDNDHAMPHGALMTGALMSGGQNTPTYGGIMTPGDGRDSRGSGRSGGTSARNQQISAPMMAENSLGWN